MAVAAATLAKGALSSSSVPSEPSVSKAQWTVIGLCIIILLLEAVIQPDIKNMLVNFKNKFVMPKTKK